MAEINVDGQVWFNTVEWPNEENWHEWQTDLTSRTTLSIYGNVTRDMESDDYGTGEFQGKQYILSPATGTMTPIALGYMKANTLAEAMKELVALVDKPVKAVAINIG